MPKVSVIIPTYNREKFVAKAIDSILSQTFRDYEIIVVDDGSTDNTRQILGPYGAKITYLYQENSGVSAARNTGIQHATGEWIAFLDSDDEWHPEYLSRQIGRVSSHPGAIFHMTNSVHISLDGKTESTFLLNGCKKKFRKKKCLIFDNPLSFILMHPLWFVQATLMHRETLLKSGLFNPTISRAEDFDLIARLALQGALGICDEELVFIYRRQEKIDSLVVQNIKNPEQARETCAKIYLNLKKMAGNSPASIKLLNRLLCSNSRALGHLVLTRGKKKEARAYYKESLSFEFTAIGLTTYILSLCPASMTIWLLNFMRTIKKRYKLFLIAKQNVII